MDKTWTWGELYAKIDSLVEEYELDPAWSDVINLCADDRGEDRDRIRDYTDGPLAFFNDYDEVRIPNNIGWYEDEFSVGFDNDNGNILLGKDWMIENYLNGIFDDEDYS